MEVSKCQQLVTAVVATGIVVIGVGLLFLVAGFLWLALMIFLRLRGKLKDSIKSLGGVPDPADFIKQVNELIKLLGWQLAIPLVVMIVGLFVVFAGVLIINGS